MSTEVTLTLPDSLVKHAENFGRSVQRSKEDVLVDTLEVMTVIWPMLENSPMPRLKPKIDMLSDEQVLMLADMKMDEIQDQRLEDLQSKGKQSGLTEAEQYELFALMQIYQVGLLRKSEGLAEAVRRGLRPPLEF